VSDDTNPTTGSDEAPGAADEPRTDPVGGDDGGAALERAQEAIDDARDAEGGVAANDDITTHDDAMAGEYSEDAYGEGGHP
jgi:hypothetical protein